MIAEDLSHILEKVDALPRLPDTIVRLIQVLRDPTTTFEQIVDTVRFDQAVTTEVLRRCNSAYFGISRNITSIDEAAKYLGAARLLQIVSAAQARVLLGPEQNGYGLAPGALWEHSVAVAIGAERIGEARHLDVGTLFTAGLLHDFGKVLLNEYVRDAFAMIVDIVKREDIPFTQAEERIFGLNHAELGARVAERWGLPEAIIRCIRHHHQPSAVSPSDALVDAVHIADCTCLLLGIGGGDDGTMYRTDAGALARAGYRERELEILGMEIVGELRTVQELVTTG